MVWDRHLLPHAAKLLKKFPVLAITGPRQSGKTTFSTMLCPEYQYVNLEFPDERAYALSDPRSFLQTYQDGAIIDEVQYVPELLSYIQAFTDERKRPGEYILTGSQNFLLNNQISQSLAGRIALFTLLPFSSCELVNSPLTTSDWRVFLYKGGYPRIYQQDIEPKDFYPSYIQTYLERDVRQLLNVGNLSVFQRFIQLLAGRVGQIFNQSALSIEVGVDNKTIASWMSILEASYIAYRLPPFYNNFSKRLIKTPKIYFYDTGLAAYLLGLRKMEDIDVHFARGALFENLVVTEIMKQIMNKGSRPQLYFWRDSNQHEIDLISDAGARRDVYEIKASHTLHQNFFKQLEYYSSLDPDAILHLVYGGDKEQKRGKVQIHTVMSLCEKADRA